MHCIPTATFTTLGELSALMQRFGKRPIEQRTSQLFFNFNGKNSNPIKIDKKISKFSIACMISLYAMSAFMECNIVALRSEFFSVKCLCPQCAFTIRTDLRISYELMSFKNSERSLESIKSVGSLKKKLGPSDSRSESYYLSQINPPS